MWTRRPGSACGLRQMGGRYSGRMRAGFLSSRIVFDKSRRILAGRLQSPSATKYSRRCGAKTSRLILQNCHRCREFCRTASPVTCWTRKPIGTRITRGGTEKSGDGNIHSPPNRSRQWQRNCKDVFRSTRESYSAIAEASERVAPTLAASDAAIKGSRLPSSTAAGLPVSWLVRRSFTN